MAEQEVDAERVEQIRRLLDAEGEAAVQHRFGEEELNSEEFRIAQRQRQQARARHQAAAEKRVREAEASEADRAAAADRDQARKREQAAEQREVEAKTAVQERGQEPGQGSGQTGDRTDAQRGPDRARQAQERVAAVRRDLAEGDRHRHEKELAGSQGRGQGR